MSDDLFSLRDATEEDLPVLTAFSHAENMDSFDDVEDVRVAVNGDDEIVGFLRLTFDADGVAYVNPVITYPSWQGYGVGRALMDDALETRGLLRLVARGTSRSFYERLGYAPIPWSDIKDELVEDCDGCPHIDECQPVPMARAR